MDKELLDTVLKIFDVVVSGELRISMSAKWEDNLAASSTCEAVGAHDMATASKVQVAPRLETLKK